MPPTKASLRRAILRTAATTHWRHDATRRALPCAVNDCPEGRTTGQEAAVSMPPTAAASNDLDVSHAAPVQPLGA